MQNAIKQQTLFFMPQIMNMYAYMYLFIGLIECDVAENKHLLFIIYYYYYYYY